MLFFYTQFVIVSYKISLDNKLFNIHTAENPPFTVGFPVVKLENTYANTDKTLLFSATAAAITAALAGLG